MKILHILFYVLVCCGAARSLTEKAVALGQNLTLKCEVSVKHVYWYQMKPRNTPKCILRSFASGSLKAKYRNPIFKKTFSLRHNSSLFIHNISTNELGVYYCARISLPSVLVSGIRLYVQNRSAAVVRSAASPGVNTEHPRADETVVRSALAKEWFQENQVDTNVGLVMMGVVVCIVLVVLITGAVQHGEWMCQDD